MLAGHFVQVPSMPCEGSPGPVLPPRKGLFTTAYSTADKSQELSRQRQDLSFRKESISYSDYQTHLCDTRSTSISFASSPDLAVDADSFYGLPHLTEKSNEGWGQATSSQKSVAALAAKGCCYTASAAADKPLAAR
ncbi:hypothetical protein BHM03_00039246 [Ensete ventricosum]|nr:hypothetical protein BHM03_00039246 [Ensete ventricosum]